ncbi:hypothetical protein FA95DRAFT_1148265 [Auriscalpium vulgare]|uniref:Uncharacterized protein n=1 Tax=Auriscalpium vulgare TaxID=40419 RepID=A0ACB8RVI0_9AGAM|nr:hypothetical protein FA95DRAFT_1148265 [Auriscalpium vulgare]
MAETTVNFLGGSPLNRLSWLRESHSFLNPIIVSPAARWVLFQAGQPLVASRSKREVGLALLTTAEVRHLLGPQPYFGQGQNEGDTVSGEVTVLQAARFKGAPVVFLGVDEPKSGTRTAPNDFSLSPEEVAANLKGTPYFSLDVSDTSQAQVDELLQECELGKSGVSLHFAEPRGATRGMSDYDAAIFAVARSMVDWNARNQFCAACGSPHYSLWAGWKLSCSSLLPWADNTGRKPCPTAKGLHNIAHPRTDAVVIMAVLNEAQDKILLGRNKKFPYKFYSSLAGFIEPGESFEDAVKRELWEEAGVHVWNVRYHSTQPWPYPANLMVGFFATGDPEEPINLSLDKELEDARWFTREEVLAVLEHKEGTNFTRRDFKTMADSIEGRANVPNKDAKDEGDPLAGDATVAASQAKEGVVQPKPTEVPADANEPPFRVPPRTAIAGVLISDWAYGRSGAQPLLKGKI